MQPDQLCSADHACWPVAEGWRAATQAFFASSAGHKLLRFLQARLDAGASIFPPQPLRALELTPPECVRVVILRQDPYHGRGQAEGLAFSVPPGVPLPPSLRNIFKELERDLGVPAPAFPRPGGSLAGWARQGVLLLNTCLTVEEGRAGSHAGQGWEQLTDALIAQVAQGSRPCRPRAGRALSSAAGTLARPARSATGRAWRCRQIHNAVITQAHPGGHWSQFRARAA